LRPGGIASFFGGNQTLIDLNDYTANGIGKRRRSLFEVGCREVAVLDALLDARLRLKNRVVGCLPSMINNGGQSRGTVESFSDCAVDSRSAVGLWRGIVGDQTRLQLV